MAILPRWFHCISHLRLLIAILVLLLIAGGMPAQAQSPVAQPEIKIIHLYEQTCPQGIDPRAGTLQDAITACPRSKTNVPFTLSSQAPGFQSQTHPTDSLSETEWHEIPSSYPWSIQQPVTFEYRNPVVRCQFGMYFDGTRPITEQTFEAPGGRLDVGLSDISLTLFLEDFCYWFDVPRTPIDVSDTAAPQAQEVAPADDSPEESPVPPGDQVSQDVQTVQGAEAAVEEPATPVSPAVQTEGTRLDIRAWQCPFHFDAAAASVDQLLANCTTPHRDANFIIDGDPATQQYTGDIGATSYQHVPFGTVTIQQLAFTSFDPVRVFCYTQPFTAPHGPLQASQEIGFTEEPGDTFSVSIDVAPGDAIDCIWFDAWVTEDDLGTLLLHKYVCPEGTNTAGFDMDLLLHACAEPQVAYFQLISGVAASGGSTDSNGYLGFIDFSPGSYLLRETTPLGYAPARIFCRSYNADDWNHIVDPWVEQPIVETTGLAVQVQAHWETECNWFDSKGVNYGYLNLTAESCPPDFTPAPTTPRLTYAQQCQVGITGGTFDVESSANFAVSATSTDGSVLFELHLPIGGMSITSSDLQVYTIVNVFCGDAPYIGIGAIPTNWTSFPDGYVQYDVPVDHQVVCEFYFRPIAIVAGAEASPAGESGALVEEASATATGDGSNEAEASPASDASAESASETGSQNNQSGGDAGSQAPSGGSTSGTSNQNNQSGSTGGNQAGTGETTGTDQPASDANAPANLSIVVFTCPPGYDLYAEDAVPSGDCPDPAIGVDFTLTASDGTTQQATSNAGGELAWTDIESGVALLQAALPPDIDRAFIAECVSDQRTFTLDNPITPFAFAGPEGQIGITVLPGEALACTWYDIPVSHGGNVTGLLFSCPGTTVIKAQCTPAPGPATLHFDPAPGSTAAAFELQIGEDGAGSSAVDEGAYLLTGLPVTACLVESDAIDTSGQLDVLEGDQVDIRIYTCGG